jgi:nucleoside phosphorylase
MTQPAGPSHPAQWPDGDRVDRVRTVVLTALELEFNAVYELLTDVRPCEHRSGTMFVTGAVHGTATRIALAMAGKGNQTAAVHVERASELFQPAAVFFVGIAGGLQRDLNLGDVVVATRVYAYHGGREDEDGFLARPRVWDAPHALLQRARFMVQTGWGDLLPPSRRSLSFSVHFGPVAAGEALLDTRSGPLRELLHRTYNDAAAIETESAGAAEAAHLNALPLLTIRGISDHADGGKMAADAGGSQRVAAAHAATLALALATGVESPHNAGGDGARPDDGHTAAATLAGVRNWSDFASHLRRLQRDTGRSLHDLPPAHDHGGLTRSGLSDALHGERRLDWPVVRDLLIAWDVPERDRDHWLHAWRRTATADPVALLTGRVAAALPRELGVHKAIPRTGTIACAGDELPTYVQRDFDDQLRGEIARGSRDGCFVILVGGSSTGKTRSLYEAVRDAVPDWLLVHPTDNAEIADLLENPRLNVVLWLDELHRYLGSTPPLTKRDMVKLVRRPTIVVGTLWPDEYTSRMAPRQVGTTDRHARDRDLLEYAHVVIGVDDAFSSGERHRAELIARTDSRIRVALHTQDAGVTQVLAGGPDVILRWKQAPEQARAVITAAADAHRLGVRGPLSRDLLEDAVYGYLPAAQRVVPAASWLDSALEYATSKVNGAIAALSEVDGGRPGTLGGYAVADYLAQYTRGVRRTERPPDTIWHALVKHLDTDSTLDELRRIAASAKARLRYCYAEQALTRLAGRGDTAATIELADTLIRQGRIEEAIQRIERCLGEQPRDAKLTAKLEKAVRIRDRADELRHAAAGGDLRATERLGEMLADLGRADELRARAGRDSVAADDLAELLADRGCLHELAERADAGHRFAADLLADLLAAQGRVELLRQRAEAGDKAANRRLAKFLAAGERDACPATAHPDAVRAQVAALRTAADAGDEPAADQLTALLFELRDEAELRAEVDAGTHLASDRLLALLTSERPAGDRDVYRLRAFGLSPDGSLFDPDAPA